MRQFYGLGLKIFNSNLHRFARKAEWKEKAKKKKKKRKSRGIPDGRVNLTKFAVITLERKPGRKEYPKVIQKLCVLEKEFPILKLS